MEKKLRLNDEDLEKVANNIRRNLVGARAATLDEYLEAAKSKSVEEIGCYELGVVKSYQRMARFLPDELLEILSRARLYTREEDKIIKGANLEQQSDEDIALLIGRDASSIMFRRIKLGLLRKNLFDWKGNPEVEEDVLATFKEENYDVIAERHGLTRDQIEHRVLRSGLRKMGLRWDDTPWKIDYLVTHYGKKSDATIARHLKLKESQIKCRAVLMGLTKGSHFNWGEHPEAVQYLRDSHRKKSNPQIARDLKLRLCQVENKVRALGLTKGEKELA